MTQDHKLPLVMASSSVNSWAAVVSKWRAHEQAVDLPFYTQCGLHPVSACHDHLTW